MISRVIPLICLILIYKSSYGNIIISSQDGNWEDSTTWNNHLVTDTIDGDSLIIKHHISFNSDLLIENSFVKLDSGGSICGQDTLHLYMSYVMQDGGDAFAKYLDLKSSVWWLADGYMQFSNGAIIWGTGASWTIHMFYPYDDTVGAYFGGGFICSNPVMYWEDTVETDTTENDTILPSAPQIPISIIINPNPHFDYFIIDSEIPDSNSHITLKIYDLLGREMKTLSIPDGNSSLTIMTSGWSAGIYFLKFQEGDNVIQTNKIIRVR